MIVDSRWFRSIVFHLWCVDHRTCIFYTPCTLLWHTFLLSFPFATSKGSIRLIFNNILSHRMQNTGLWPSLQLFMSHHAPCSNLLMRLTCLSPSPSCSSSPLFLSLLAFLLFTSDAPSLSAHLSQGKVKWEGRTAMPIFLLHLKTWSWMSERWDHPLEFWGLRFWDRKCSGYTSLFSFTHCSADITVSTTASLEQEKYPGWIPS